MTISQNSYCNRLTQSAQNGKINYVYKCKGGAKLVHLSQREIEKIEKAISKGGRTEAVVKVENGQIVVLLVERKKIS